ncbi:GT-D fold domain-containing glycosyltransferase [Actinoplanes sp. NPDC049118]|uniref:GT-D fold domain-containing glycosyltransferase n=1 Tax=Actinoplanes sp. NPDC049118 TaxID=3155769 RepID=UPI0033DD4E95
MSEPTKATVWHKVRRRIAGSPRPETRLLKALKEQSAEAKKQAAEVRKHEKSTTQLLTDIRWEMREQRKYLEGFRALAARETFAEIREFTEACQLGFEDTVRKVARERISLARFGDGELKTMLRPEFNLRFQPWSAALAGDLRQVLRMDGYDRDKLMVAFPYTFRNVHWTGVWLDIWPEVKPLLDTSLTWGMAHVSRPQYFIHLGRQGVQLWRDVWDAKEIVIVTGEGSRFVLEPALFDNAKSIEFVYSKPVNAYADLPRLMPLLEAADPDKLFLIALGPTGTLLAAKLAQAGRWAIDIGHISESYANVFEGGKWPEAMGVVKK